MTSTATAWAAPAANAPLQRTTIERRELGPKDVQIEIAYSGICHSDIHTVRDEWGQATYPLVPGHEIVGHVTAVGAEVTKYKAGDRAGVGVLVDSCRTCDACTAGEENYCESGMTGTYNAPLPDGTVTQGGYATSIVTDEHFVHHIPQGLDLAAAAPLLCAGITTYAPLVNWGVTKGSRVAVVGLGGLGHVGVKFTVAMGAEVTVLSQSTAKAQLSKAMGATRHLATSDEATFTDNARGFDLILNTVSANLDLRAYAKMLDRGGVMVNVGMPPEGLSMNLGALNVPRLAVAGSMIGGIPQTQEMLEFAAEHGITADVEIVDAEGINDAYDRVVNSDVRFRFVIDVDSMRP